MFYDGTKLLSMMDINGNAPGIRAVTSNRSAGKTTFFARVLINKVLKHKIRRFAVLYRFKNELKGCGDSFFKDIRGLFFPKYVMTDKPMKNELYYELHLAPIADLAAERCVGYAFAINSADKLRRISHLFNDVDVIFFDEFQPESGLYVDDELNKFLSILTSVARGNGQHVRPIEVWMASNTVTVLNPYFTAWKISARLRSDTKFLRAPGLVLEQGYVESAANALQSAGFMQAFSDSNYVAYATESVYLNDDNALIGKPSGRSRYLATFVYQGRPFAVRYFSDYNQLYVDKRPDLSFPLCIACAASDITNGAVLRQPNDGTILQLRAYFRNGLFRFQDQEARAATYTLLSY